MERVRLNRPLSNPESFSALIADVILSRFQISDVPVLVRPTFDFRFGEFSSDIAVRISKILKKSSTQIAEEIISSISSHESLKISTENGYINFETEELSGDVSFASELTDFTSLKPLEVCSSRSGFWNESLLCAARIRALELLSTQLFSAYFAEPLAENHQTALISKDALFFDQFQNLTPNKKYLLYVPSRGAQSSHLKELLRKNNESLVVKVLRQGWCASPKTANLESSFEHYKYAAGDLSFLLYLASDRDLSELDLQVPALQEQGNLYWYINEVLRRARIFPLSSRESVDLISFKNLEEKRLLFRAKYLLSHLLWSLEQGELPRFIRELEIFLKDFAKYMFRSPLTTTRSSKDIMIISKVYDTVLQFSEALIARAKSRNIFCSID